MNCSPQAAVTDDSIMTLAVAKAIMEATKTQDTKEPGRNDDFHARLSDLTVKYMQEIGRKYPNCGFGYVLQVGLQP